MIKLFRYLIAVGLTCLLLDGIFSYAQETDEVSVDISQRIVNFFEVAEPTNPSETSALMELPYSVTYTRDVVEAVFHRDVNRLSETVQAIEPDSFQDVIEFDELAWFSEALLIAMKEDQGSDKNTRLIEVLEEHLDHERWFLSSIAGSLLSHVYMTQNDFLISAGYIEDAINIIPSELSPETTFARLSASDRAMALHGVQGNPAFMLEAPRIQKQTKQRLGEEINRYEMMTNFIYALNQDRDFSGAAEIAKLLVKEVKPDNAVPGLAETYMAETYNALGQYGMALSLAETALSEATHPVISQRVRRPKMIAFAGLGRESKAREWMKEWGWDYDRSALLNTVTNRDVLYAEALLAMHRGETELSVALTKRWADLQINRVQASNSAGMTSLLSNLENTRDRQAEREGALQREAELKAIQLEQQSRLNRMLWILIGGLTLAFNMLLAFLRYREKNNRKVQKLSEEALSAEKMKTEFLGVINHELRTPLNGIIGISDAMIHNTQDPALLAQAKAVQDSGQVLFDLLDSLITMSTIEGNRLTLDTDDVRLDRVVSGEALDWTMSAEDKGLAFTHFVGPELSDVVVGDAKRLRQCLHYLLSNAIRFTHEGRVHVHATGKVEQGHMLATIIVADTGQGISDDVQSRLFKPFLQADAYMTRKYGGAGLSLAIARKLARMMDGDVTVNSREGRGSEFTLTVKLPLLAYQDEAIRDAEGREQLAAEVESRDLVSPIGKMDIPVEGPKVDHVDEPEEIIDLMLSHPIFNEADPSASQEDEVLGEQSARL